MNWLLRLASVAWAGALPLAALVTTRPSGATWGIGYAFALFVYAIGSYLCHQRPERSFHLLGVQLPVCARCTGIYAGAAMVAIVLSVGRVLSSFDKAQDDPESVEGSDPPYLRRTARTALLVSALPTIATLAYEWTTGDTPGNWTRAISGVPLGACIAWIVFAGLQPPARGREPHGAVGGSGPRRNAVVN